MGVLIWVLIIIFIILISYQVFLAHFLDNKYNTNYNYTIIEGLTTTSSSSFQEYNDTDATDALELAQQNEDNILFLKGQIQDISGNVGTLAKQVSQIVKAQQDSANQVAPSSPPVIGGTLD